MDADRLTDTSRRLGVVAGNDHLGTMRLLRVRLSDWAQARPGQFALLQAENSDCFLGRALSVCDQSDDEVCFLVASVGKGTRELCALAVGERVWVLGPLGNGFDLMALTAGAERILLVGGGAGVAPFPLLISKLAAFLVSGRVQGDKGGGSRDSGGKGGVEKGDEKRPSLLVLTGFRDIEQARGCGPLVESVSRVEARVVSCTYEEVVEEGRDGPSERASDLLARHLREGDHVAVCGPEAMARAVWDVCRQVPGVKVWFSLETNMACGVGSCHGCVVTLADGSYTRVCREGPVFAGEEVFGG